MPNGFFRQNLLKRSKTGKSEPYHWVLHIRNNLGTKFKLKLAILIFWTKFALKG